MQCFEELKKCFPCVVPEQTQIQARYFTLLTEMTTTLERNEYLIEPSKEAILTNVIKVNHK